MRELWQALRPVTVLAAALLAAAVIIMDTTGPPGPAPQAPGASPTLAPAVR